MQQEAADELVGGESHGAGLVGIGGAVLFVLKSHLTLADVQYSPVVDGNAVCVTAKIFQHPVQTTEGRFAVDHPLGLSQRCDQLGKHGGFPERGDLAGEAQKISPESVFERFEKEPPKQT